MSPKTSFADEAKAGPPNKATSRTKIDLWLDAATKEDRDAAVAILADPEWRHTDIALLLNRHGCDVSDVQVGQYRRRRRYDTR